MQVSVKSPTGKTIFLDATSEDTVEKMKAQIQDLEGIAQEEQELIFAGTYLQDGRRLSDYAIEPQDIWRPGASVAVIDLKQKDHRRCIVVWCVLVLLNWLLDQLLSLAALVGFRPPKYMYSDLEEAEAENLKQCKLEEADVESFKHCKDEHNMEIIDGDTIDAATRA